MFYVTLAIPDEVHANWMVEDMRNYPENDILTPGQENPVHARIVATWEGE